MKKMKRNGVSAFCRWVAVSFLVLAEKIVPDPMVRSEAMAVLFSPAFSLADAHAYPVPFVTSKGDTTITFTDLSSIATIRILTLNGEIVVTLQETDGDGQLVWDTRNQDGNFVTSGVYIYQIKSSADEKTGKLVIVR